jgi:hypothetical protein
MAIWKMGRGVRFLHRIHNRIHFLLSYVDLVPIGVDGRITAGRGGNDGWPSMDSCQCFTYFSLLSMVYGLHNTCLCHEQYGSYEDLSYAS